jgi:hypothetical protein
VLAAGQKAQTLLSQVEAQRMLSTSLGHEKAQVA